MKRDKPCRRCGGTGKNEKAPPVKERADAAPVAAQCDLCAGTGGEGDGGEPMISVRVPVNSALGRVIAAERAKMVAEGEARAARGEEPA